MNVWMKTANYIFLGLIFISLSSCYKEFLIPAEESIGDFNFHLTPEQEQELYNARGVSYQVVDPIPKLYRNEEKFQLDRFEIRGESTLNFRRKSFSINMDTFFYLNIPREGRLRDIEEYKLISLVYDYTYIEAAIAIGIFHKMDFWPTHSEYTEVKLNNNTQGVYLLIEDPVEHFLYQKDASFILRRDYNHTHKKYHLNEFRETETEEHYLAMFDSIYSYIARYDGIQLYEKLMSVVDLSQYFAKMAIDMLLQNGDYTDEVFFYIKEVEGKEIYGIYPWDYDDLFEPIPHEIGRAWAVGTVFGSRVYGSVQNIIDEVGELLIFSIEDDLDYKIAIDDYLYQRYLEVLEEVLTIIDDQTIESVLSDAKTQLQPFYNNHEIIAQSVYDVTKTNQKLFDENLVAKKQFLLDRRKYILQELPNHKN